jgi:hypothetical protein
MMVDDPGMHCLLPKILCPWFAFSLMMCVYDQPATIINKGLDDEAHPTDFMIFYDLVQ